MPGMVPLIGWFWFAGCGWLSQASGTTFAELPPQHVGAYEGMLLPFPAQRQGLVHTNDFSEAIPWSAEELYGWGYMSTKGEMVVSPGEFSMLDPIVGDEVVAARVSWREVEPNRLQVYSHAHLLTERGTRKVGEPWAWIAPDTGPVFRARNSLSKMGPTEAALLGPDGAVVAAVTTWDDGMNDVGPFREGLAVGSKVMNVGSLRPWLPDDTMRSLAERGWENDTQTIENGPMVWGVMDTSGTWVIEPSWMYLDAYGDGLAPAANKERAEVGFIDKTGAWVIPPTFASATSFRHGIATVWRGDQCQFIRPDGTPVIDSWFARCGAWGQSYLQVAREKEGPLEVLDRKGQATAHLSKLKGAPEDFGLESGSWLAVNVGVSWETAWWMVNANGERLLDTPLNNETSPCFLGGVMLAVLPLDLDKPVESLELRMGGYVREDGTWLWGPVLGPWPALSRRWTDRCSAG